MAGDTEDVVKGYLHRLLSDGTRPFSYRGGVRALLGLPESDGLETNFFKPPVTRFTYVVPRFRGEFEFPDELSVSGAPRVTFAEEISPPVLRSAVMPEREQMLQGHPPDRQAARPTEQPSKLPRKEQSIVIPGSAAVRTGGTNAKEPSPTDKEPSPTSEEPSPTKSRPMGVRTLTGHAGSKSPLKTPNVVIPTLRFPAPLAHVPQSGATDQHESATEGDHAAAVGGLSQTGLATSVPKRMADALSPSDPAGASAVLNQTVLGSHIARAHPGGHQPKPRPPSQESPDTILPRESELSRKRLQAESSHVVYSRLRSSGPRIQLEQVCQDAMTKPRTFPLVRGRDQRRGSGVRRNSETPQHSSIDAGGQTPPVPLTHPPLIVVKKNSDQGSTPFGFWERRYLSHLRLRIRR